MGREEENICRLCFKVVTTKCFGIDDVMKMMLDVLLLQLNWDVSKDPVVCQECVKITIDCYYFKSQCLDTELHILSSGVDRRETEFQINDIFEHNNSFQKYLSVCRFCMEQLGRDNSVPIGLLVGQSTLKMMPLFMPELDFNIIKNPVTCVPCGEKLENYFNLVLNFLDIEPRRETKQEPEAFYIKRNAYLKEQKVIRAEETLHIKDNVLGKTFKCTMCTYKTVYKGNLNRHTLVHKGTSKLKLFNCTTCAYVTRDKSNLNKHILIHKDISERKLKLYNCTTCTYESRHKSNLNKHMLTHKTSSEVAMYKCATCNYETKWISSMKHHLLTHKDNSELEMYKCTLCPYETRYKRYLREHNMLKHKIPSDVETFKCFICNYETTIRYRFNNHMLVHEGSSETGIYKCTTCIYETKRKDNFKKHMLNHNV